jgi:hypothetical protein
MTSNELLDLRELPESLLVVGVGLHRGRVRQHPGRPGLLG